MRAFLILSCMSASASAHSWYDPACCSDQDCHPTDQVRETPEGYRIKNRLYPYGFARRSLDDQFHICERFGEVICLYAPLRSY